MYRTLRVFLQARLTVPGGQTESRSQAHGAPDKLQGSLVDPQFNDNNNNNNNQHKF
jgi:hypothetical protein